MAKAAQPAMLIVEDDEGLQNQLRWSFDDYNVTIAGDRNSALMAINKHQPAVVTLDLGLPPDPANASEGLKALDEILAQAPFTKVIVVTGNDDHAVALDAISRGAYDYCQKPVDIELLKLIVSRAHYLAALERENRELQKTLNQTGPFSEIIGNSPELNLVVQTAQKVASSNASILILGESGSGKELIAQSVHQASPRADQALIAINCAAIPGELLESELFGYEKGAFTGAAKSTPGKIELADGGTLFLDEIGDMPIALQAKILRFLESRTFERIGGREEITVDVRIICATHQDLQSLISEQLFREDLYYRIGEIEITLPPLRDRISDIPVIASAFLTRFAKEQNSPVTGFNDEALNLLGNYPWPGNIRELKNAVKRAVIMCDGKRISPVDLGLTTTPPTDQTNPADPPAINYDLKEARATAERVAINNALTRCDGNLSSAAELLGVTRPTLYALMERLDIENK
ncbi:MAG: PEP-CTERM-box response regulator transcription factor [Gammaproteobacteria bacterium]